MGDRNNPIAPQGAPSGYRLEFTMGPHDTFDRSATRMPMALKQAIVIGVVLAAIGYGMAKVGVHSPATPAEAAAARSGHAATVVPRPAPQEDQVLREDDPRPCEPQRGITERCTY